MCEQTLQGCVNEAVLAIVPMQPWWQSVSENVVQSASENVVAKCESKHCRDA